MAVGAAVLVKPAVAALPPEFAHMTTRERARASRWNLDLNPRAPFEPLGFNITCVPDALYPWPAWMVRLIRQEYDPGLVPIFRRMVYQTQAGSRLVFYHHGVARFHPNAEPDPVLQNVQLPYGWKFERPNVVERWFEQDRSRTRRGSIRHKNNLPMPFIPWTEWVLRWVEETYWEATAAEKARYNDEHGVHVEAERERKFQESEAAHANQSEQKYRQREQEKLTPEDMSYVRGVSTGQVKPEPKPFVQIGAQS